MKACIATVMNDAYATLGAVLIFSLAKQGMLEQADLVVVCTDSGEADSLSPENRRDLRRVHNNIQFLEVRDVSIHKDFLRRCPRSDPRYLPAFFSLELFLNEAFEAYDTICYVDADMLCIREFSFVFSEYDPSFINGSTCSEPVGNPGISDCYLNTGFFILSRALLPICRNTLLRICPSEPLRFEFGSWDKLIINKYLLAYVKQPFTGCNFLPTRGNLGAHRLLHFEGAEWKPTTVQAPIREEFGYLFDEWWKYRRELEATRGSFDAI